MVQNPKGGGLSSTFGGGGNQQIGGVQKTTDFLDKSTWALGTILIVLILITNFSNLSANDRQSKLANKEVKQTEQPATIVVFHRYNIQKMPASDKLAFFYFNLSAFLQWHNFCLLGMRKLIKQLKN